MRFKKAISFGLISALSIFSLMTNAADLKTKSMNESIKKEAISTEKAPKAIGPYSQAIKKGNMLFLSGQIPTDPITGKIIGATIQEQTTQVLENLKAVLAANNMTMNDIVSTSVFMTNLNDFTQMNNAYAHYFTDAPPARATVQVSLLPKEVMVEISAIAIK